MWSCGSSSEASNAWLGWLKCGTMEVLETKKFLTLCCFYPFIGLSKTFWIVCDWWFILMATSYSRWTVLLQLEGLCWEGKVKLFHVTFPSFLMLSVLLTGSLCQCIEWPDQIGLVSQCGPCSWTLGKCICYTFVIQMYLNILGVETWADIAMVFPEKISIVQVYESEAIEENNVFWWRSRGDFMRKCVMGQSW